LRGGSIHRGELEAAYCKRGPPNKNKREDPQVETHLDPQQKSAEERNSVKDQERRAMGRSRTNAHTQKEIGVWERQRERGGSGRFALMVAKGKAKLIRVVQSQGKKMRKRGGGGGLAMEKTNTGRR